MPHDLLGVISPEAFTALVRMHGGTTIEARHISGLQPEDAESLRRYIGGSSVYIPNGKIGGNDRRDREIIAAYSSGETVKSLARRHGLSDRRIWMILKKPL